jgi:hypothetical protein
VCLCSKQLTSGTTDIFNRKISKFHSIQLSWECYCPRKRARPR